MEQGILILKNKLFFIRHKIFHIKSFFYFYKKINLKDYFDKYQRTRLIKTNISVVLSITIVLFLLGILGFFVLNSKKITNHFKEKVIITIFFKDKAKLADIKKFEKTIKLNKEVKMVKFISKKQAAEGLKKDLGEDFVSFLGYNPLQNNLEVNLNGMYVNEEKMDELAKKWKKNPTVSDVSYQYYKPLIKILNQNVKKMSFWIGIISLFFLLLIFFLINSAIRLSIYGKRFSIRTMQMVGATKNFIRKPFLKKAFILGLIGATLSSLLILGLLYFLDNYFPDFHFLKDYKLMIILIGFIYLIGSGITLLSTLLATNHFLKIKSEQIHF